MHKHNDAYGTCPRCEYVGWHPYKGKAIIFGDSKSKFKVSLFKCPKCGKKFGFDLGGDIPEPKIKSPTRYYDKKYSSYYKPPKEEENDEFDAMLEALNDDYDKDEPEYYKITPDEVSNVIYELQDIADAVNYGNLNAADGATILLSVKSIGTILDKIKNRG